MEIYKIKVLNFDEHNEKAVGRSMSWFKFQSKLARSSKYLCLSSGAKHLWIWLLCEAAQSTTRTAWIRPRDIMREIHVTPRCFMGVVCELLSIEWIQVVSGPRLDKIRGDKIRIDEKSEVEFSGPSEQENKSKSTSPKPAKPRSDGSVQLAIARYCEVWKSRYSASPPIGGKESGIFKSLVKDHGLDKTLSFIEAYLQMPDHWFVTKRHDIGTMKGSLNSIVQFIATGKMITRKEINQLDTAVSNQNTLDALRAGEI